MAATNRPVSAEIDMKIVMPEANWKGGKVQVKHP
jgi:hypothetical protein